MSEARERRPGPPRGKHRQHKKPKGIALDGWLIIDKPTGVGSTDVVTLCKRGFNAQRCGHGGTLDPLATGVLPIAFGAATKTVPYVMDGTKTYRFTLKFGEARDSDDADGKVIATSDVRPDDATIRAALPQFIGDIMQVPPIFSAIKVAGERAYDLARAGEIPELAPRPARVDRFELIERPDADTAVFFVESGKGVYMRSLARDIAQDCGTVGHITALRRMRVGPFHEPRSCLVILIGLGLQIALHLGPAHHFIYVHGVIQRRIRLEMQIRREFEPHTMGDLSPQEGTHALEPRQFFLGDFPPEYRNKSGHVLQIG